MVTSYNLKKLRKEIDDQTNLLKAYLNFINSFFHLILITEKYYSKNLIELIDLKNIEEMN